MFAPAEFLSLEHTAHPKLFENQNYVWDALKQIASYLQFRLKPAVLGELMGKPIYQQPCFYWPRNGRRTGRGVERPGLDRRKLPHPQRLLRARKRDRRQRRRDGQLLRIQELHPLRRSAGAAFQLRRRFDSWSPSASRRRRDSLQRKTRSREIAVVTPDGHIPTGLTKFGAIVGDRTEIGCNAVINPGSVIGRDCMIYPSVNFRGVLPERQRGQAATGTLQSC